MFDLCELNVMTRKRIVLKKKYLLFKINALSSLGNELIDAPIYSLFFAVNIDLELINYIPCYQ